MWSLLPFTVEAPAAAVFCSQKLGLMHFGKAAGLRPSVGVVENFFPMVVSPHINNVMRVPTYLRVDSGRYGWCNLHVDHKLIQVGAFLGGCFCLPLIVAPLQGRCLKQKIDGARVIVVELESCHTAQSGQLSDLSIWGRRRAFLVILALSCGHVPNCSNNGSPMLRPRSAKHRASLGAKRARCPRP